MFRHLRSFKFSVVAPRIFLPEVQHSESGEVKTVQVCQSKELPDSSTSSVSAQIAAGVPLKKTSTVMIRDVSVVPSSLQAALDADAEFNANNKQSGSQQPDPNKDGKKED